MAHGVQPRCRVTLVDDNLDFLDLMQELLAERYEVVAISGRRVTLEAIADSRPDLVMVDVHLDDTALQGWFVTLLRAHRYLRGVPIVVCSADVGGLTGRADAVLATGNTAVLYKPFSLDAVEELISRGLSVGFAAGQPTDDDERRADVASDAGMVGTGWAWAGGTGVRGSVSG